MKLKSDSYASTRGREELIRVVVFEAGRRTYDEEKLLALVIETYPVREGEAETRRVNCGEQGGFCFSYLEQMADWQLLGLLWWLDSSYVELLQ